MIDAAGKVACVVAHCRSRELIRLGLVIAAQLIVHKDMHNFRMFAVLHADPGLSGYCPDGISDLIGQLRDQRCILAFHHDANQRFGAGRTQQYTSVLVQGLFR